MRRYEEDVEVRRGEVAGWPGEEGPAQLLWRGRLWRVRAVLARWIETGAWWGGGDADALRGTDEPAAARREVPGRVPGQVPGDGDLLERLLVERECWRVEVGRGRDVGAGDGGGVVELAFDTVDGRWQLVGCAD
ncbi:DUF6504 family protein [Nocardioides sp. GY 10127]|uniref:DUF6504 family protein n=1 Tax=Nocardioides sp. GY 10127 TaxID=2569762 RepID=UPI0010A868D7|nr:DUF6504 family protein [Nocardioides sp. GY 10127]TIC80963.1 hypothetical protein E8D37_14150 [Nocardioides sp. GY 10127]